jgi:excisionase family DNA binding protein
MNESRYLTVDEVAEYLQIHRTTVYRMLSERKLPGFRVGRDWRFNVEAVKQWQLDLMSKEA